jgi:hypothetical protein
MQEWRSEIAGDFSRAEEEHETALMGEPIRAVSCHSSTSVPSDGRVELLLDIRNVLWCEARRLL